MDVSVVVGKGTATSDDGADLFRAAHRRYKRGSDLSDDDIWAELVDFSCATGADPNIVPLPPHRCCCRDKGGLAGANGDGDGGSGCCAAYRGPTFGLSSHSGFVYVPAAISADARADLARLCLSRWCESPHATNIDLVPPGPGEAVNGKGESIWEIWKRDQGLSAAPMSVAGECGAGYGKDDGQKKDIVERRTGKRKYYRRLEKLAWSTAGYQYDWAERVYREEAKSPVPPEFLRLSSVFAPLGLQGGCDEEYAPQAVIVNFYRAPKSVMGGHADDLEHDFSKPVVSLSLGLPAIFLLGGKTRRDASQPVIPILVRPGDVMVLGGASRLCYHGVARVMRPDMALPPLDHRWRDSEFQVQNISCRGSSCHSNGLTSSTPATEVVRCKVEDQDRAEAVIYLSNHRININVRQVLPDGVDSLLNLKANHDDGTICA